jgi:hypothetical protein
VLRLGYGVVEQADTAVTATTLAPISTLLRRRHRRAGFG